jgi:excisionase family DNA binding protein
MSQATAEVENLITIAQAAREVGIAHHVLRRLLARGRIRSVRIGGLPKVRLSDVRSAIEEYPACNHQGG